MRLKDPCVCLKEEYVAYITLAQPTDASKSPSYRATNPSSQASVRGVLHLFDTILAGVFSPSQPHTEGGCSDESLDWSAQEERACSVASWTTSWRGCTKGMREKQQGKATGNRRSCAAEPLMRRQALPKALVLCREQGWASALLILKRFLPSMCPSLLTLSAEIPWAVEKGVHASGPTRVSRLNRVLAKWSCGFDQRIKALNHYNKA